MPVYLPPFFRIIGTLSTLFALYGCGAWQSIPEATPDAARSFEVPDRSTKFSTPDALSAFKAETDQVSDYLLGDGDDIFVEVVGYAELSGKHRIGPDGRITLPVAGPVLLRELTRQQAGNLITQALTPYYRNVYTTVRVEQYTSNHVTVIGRVEHPGSLDFDTPPTLLEILAKAGGLPLLRKEQVLTRCAIIRKDRILWIDLKRLLTGDIRLNVHLQRKDVIYIPDSTDTSVYVLGDVRDPGVYRLTPQMSFLDALGQAGGPTKDANPNDIRLIRSSKNVNMQIDLEDVITPDRTLNVAIEEGDIIFVPRNGVAKVGYIMQQANPFGYVQMFRQFMPTP